jgi:uncharacterized membrane protein
MEPAKDETDRRPDGTTSGGFRRGRVARTDARRLESFSDGVFAIAITLLVLNLSIAKGLPTSEVWSAITDQQDELISAAISFAIIGIYWVSHRTTFDRIAESDGALTAVNFMHLAVVVFMPFPTLVLAEYGNSFAAVAMYAITIALAGYTAAGTVWIAWRHELLRPGVDRDWVVARMTGMVTTPSVFLLSIGIAVFNPSLATWFWLVGFIVSPIADRIATRYLRTQEQHGEGGSENATQSS